MTAKKKYIFKDLIVIWYPDESVFGLKFLCALYGVINQTEPTGLPTSKVRPKFEHKDRVWIFDLIQLRQLFFQLSLHLRTTIWEIGQKNKTKLKYAVMSQGKSDGKSAPWKHSAFPDVGRR